jgi:hypothetical protein
MVSKATALRPSGAYTPGDIVRKGGIQSPGDARLSKSAEKYCPVQTGPSDKHKELCEKGMKIIAGLVVWLSPLEDNNMMCRNFKIY